MSDVADLIQSTEVYECFDGNAVEVEIMLDYLSNQHITPRHIYGEASLPLLSFIGILTRPTRHRSYSIYNRSRARSPR